MKVRDMTIVGEWGERKIEIEKFHDELTIREKREDEKTDDIIIEFKDVDFLIEALQKIKEQTE